ncbi:MAG: hypothetical protein P8Y53_14010 [Pseudolabrys sp.]|jgi:hypothetical protein
MSGCADSDEALMGRGAAGMIAKPFDAATLGATVRRHLHTPSSWTQPAAISPGFLRKPAAPCSRIEGWERGSEETR